MACFLSTCASTRRFGIPVVGGAGVRWGGLARTYLRWCPPLRASCRDEDRPRQPCGTGRRRRNAAWNASAFWRSAVRASRSASAALTSDSACAARARASTSAALLSRCRTRLDCSLASDRRESARSACFVLRWRPTMTTTATMTAITTTVKISQSHPPNCVQLSSRAAAIGS